MQSSLHISPITRLFLFLARDNFTFSAIRGFLYNKLNTVLDNATWQMRGVLAAIEKNELSQEEASNMYPSIERLCNVINKYIAVLEKENNHLLSERMQQLTKKIYTFQQLVNDLEGNLDILSDSDFLQSANMNSLEMDKGHFIKLEELNVQR